MHSRTFFVSSLLLLTAAASTSVSPVEPVYTPPSYWRNIPPPLDDYRAAYRAFKSGQNSHDSVSDSDSDRSSLHESAWTGHQIAMAESQPQMASHQSSQSQSISDILPLHRAINIFASLARSSSSLAPRLDSPLASQKTNTTVLAPLNSVMQRLPRKPWEDSPQQLHERATTHTGAEPAAARWSQDTAAANLDRFVLGHVVPVSPWREGKENAIFTLADSESNSHVDAVGHGESPNTNTKGRKIWWEKRGGGADGSEEKRVIMPDEIVVEGVVGRVGNGEVWALRGVIGFEGV